MEFMDKRHEAFYNDCLERGKCAGDCYREALFYTLGLNEETRKHVDRLYDFRERGIRPEGLAEGWQTSGSLRVVRLAFNLYNGFCEDGYETEYTPYRLFNRDALLPWMLRAVMV